MTESDSPTGSSPDTAALRRSLESAATRIDIGSIDETRHVVERTAARRRRRSTALVGIAAVATLVVGGVVVTNIVGDDDGDDRIVSAPATEPPAVEEPGATDTTQDEAEAAAPGTAGPAAAPAGSDASTVTVDVQPAAASASAWTSETVMPWKDGFLIVGQEQFLQPLPSELPEEITALFPDEVIQFFEEVGGLPPTIQEATEMLNEAGLFDEVSEVVLANPDVNAFIYSQPAPEPRSYARVSPDGVTWTEVEIDVPLLTYNVVSTGDRLVTYEVETDQSTSGSFNPLDSPAEFLPPVTTAIIVSTTTDLQTWIDVRIPVEPPVNDLPSYVHSEVYPGQLVANDVGWVLDVTESQYPQYEALMAETIGLDMEQYPNGYSTYPTEDGVVLQTFDEDGTVTEATYTWDDLGVDAPADAADGSFGDESVTRWSATWDGEPTAVELEPFQYSQLFAFGSGVFSSDGTAFLLSTDFATWTPVGNPGASDGWPMALIDADTGPVMILRGNDGSASAYSFDTTTLTWSPVDLDLPDGFFTWSPGSSAVLYSIDNYDESYESPPIEDFDLSFENDAYRLDVTIRSDSQSYALIDLATGETLAAETVDAADSSEIPFEGIEQQPDGGITIVSLETGEAITTFTAEQLSVETTAVEQSSTTTYVEGEMEYVQPEMYVLATHDGVWLNESLDVISPDVDPASRPMMPSTVAANGNVVVVANSDGSTIRFEF
jgi:hypothetical protein